ncbi:MAG TPA: class I SAM-dependent methyltransferase [Nocardioidaceae bacterium]|jgi:SAM-dependent methyltransferase|nr:class I SAM-dependent methyltransferase [Nocardioidaceae bacterium]
MGTEPVRRTVSEAESRRANRGDWDANADEYQATHGEFLGDVGFVWGPEGLTEEQAGLLGPVAGRDVLEVGCGAAQCARWLACHGARVVAVDLSFRQLQHARRIDQETGVPVAAACATATGLPFRAGSFDVAFSAFGALQFVHDADGAVREVARVLRPGGRFAFSVTHPVRWSMPDDPGPEGLRVTGSYFDRTPYVEQDDDGTARYVEHHRTVGDWVRLLHAAGFHLLDLVEPEWPEGHDRVWGGWGPVRGALLPGTAIFVSRLEERTYSR